MRRGMPGSMRTRQELSDLIEGRLTSTQLPSRTAGRAGGDANALVPCRFRTGVTQRMIRRFAGVCASLRTTCSPTFSRPASGLGRITVSTGTSASKRSILSQALAEQFQSGFKCDMI